eukprot:scaffold35698_cov63-Attheya_sp.AAC.20
MDTHLDEMMKEVFHQMNQSIQDIKNSITLVTCMIHPQTLVQQRHSHTHDASALHATTSTQQPSRAMALPPPRHHEQAEHMDRSRGARTLHGVLPGTWH